MPLLLCFQPADSSPLIWRLWLVFQHLANKVDQIYHHPLTSQPHQPYKEISSLSNNHLRSVDLWANVGNFYNCICTICTKAKLKCQRQEGIITNEMLVISFVSACCVCVSTHCVSLCPKNLEFNRSQQKPFARWLLQALSWKTCGSAAGTGDAKSEQTCAGWKSQFICLIATNASGQRHSCRRAK